MYISGRAGGNKRTTKGTQIDEFEGIIEGRGMGSWELANTGFWGCRKLSQQGLGLSGAELRQKSFGAY